jgi:hypothetical protein
MKKYHQLADLEVLLIDIPDSNIRAYAQESVTCYFAGAYRATIVSIWIAVVFDLYQKIRYLAEQYDDPGAKDCIKEIDNIQSSADNK